MNNDNHIEKRDEDGSSSMKASRETLPIEADLETKQRIGNFKLLSVLGEGGMGTVWLAEQDHPVKRRVAVKVIKSGQAPKEFLRRFEAERQALAIMDHPNIAKFLEAGATEDGIPFLAMELVKGLAITKYCDKHKLNIDNRLKLFGKVCNAVQHAHQKGIIHRDLKPSNILVVEIEGKPIPKVIDFGLAKAAENSLRLAQGTLYTEIGQLIGTVKYMSPEQASLDVMDVDTRTDIYALGVVLYELLTGSTPLNDSTVKENAVLKLLEIIREQTPVKPSSRLNSSAPDYRNSVTHARRTNNLSLSKSLEGDLDWVVMKALENDKSQRYGSASEFAADITRFLDSEPVIARPPNFWYHSKKFYIKNRRSVLLATLFLIITVVGVSGMIVGHFRLQAANKVAEAERMRADASDVARQRIMEVNTLLQARHHELSEARMMQEKFAQENARLRKEIEVLRELLKEQADSDD